MASLSMHIQCGVCLHDLRDPVCLPCQHSYCRVCITRHLAVNGDENRCPECRSPFRREDVRVNRTLRNIVDAVRAHLEEQESLRETSMSTLRRQNWTSTDQCPNHFETFSLFCETDHKLICVACRGDRRHQGHRFKNLSEAFQANKLKAAEKFDILVCENETLVELIESQADEIIRTREQSKALSDQISEQFEQMHQFLRDKEDEVKALLLVEEDNILERMEVNLFSMEEMLSEVKVNQGVLVSALETDEPCQFLQWWTECGQSLIGQTASSQQMRSPVSDVRVIRDTLFLGPYETDLKVTVCKDMCKSIQRDLPVSSVSPLNII
ncbi:nuclear factor 7, brain-like isoform X2 [Colossoma macropomum]|uniref:nuclear factor 7, brain-like isoform X2 n=2 Tax=Colossoma macropomum TaxID=42526 RepID=UPI0018649EB9|nr:nuclear factor 7, brain-like isoform X2 [Colossoma macropomum]